MMRLDSVLRRFALITHGDGVDMTVSKGFGVSRVSLWALTLTAASVLVCSDIRAQERCNAEVKLLVSPAQTERVLAAFHAGTPSHSEIYFYDSESLELLSQGLIVRMRTGAQRDLTAKLTSSEAESCKCPTYAGGAGKCEADLVGDREFTSLSVGKAFKGMQALETGEQVQSALSPEQIRVLSAAGVSVDWHRVQRIAEVRATTWKARSSAAPKKLTVEMWEWPGGKVLELSARVEAQGGAAAVKALRETAERHGLTIEENQTTKSELVLRGSVRPARKGNQRSGKCFDVR